MIEYWGEKYENKLFDWYVQFWLAGKWREETLGGWISFEALEIKKTKIEAMRRKNWMIDCGIYIFGLWAELGVHSIGDSHIVKAQSCSIMFELFEKQDLSL